VVDKRGSGSDDGDAGADFPVVSWRRRINTGMALPTMSYQATDAAQATLSSER
jgi:hypothetical protein